VDEHEVDTPEEAAFFMANEVVNEYHSFPVVQRADIAGANIMFIQINGRWFKAEFNYVGNRSRIDQLERLAENAE
jgi:hypothetical protein